MNMDIMTAAKTMSLRSTGRGVAKFLPLHAALTEILLHLRSAKLVVNHTTESNAVTEGLEGRNGVFEQEHGGEDEENILEYTAEGESERRGPADLENC